VKSCNKILCRSHSIQPVNRTLVEDLKYKFRIKSAKKKDLPDARQGLTPLTKISVQDVRSIWIHSLVGEKGLPTSKVFLSEEVFVAMDLQLRKALEIDENGLVEFEDYLPTMVHLIRTKVTPEDEQEIAKELLDFWFPDKHLITEANREAVWEDLKMKTNNVMTAIKNIDKDSSVPILWQ